MGRNFLDIRLRMIFNNKRQLTQSLINSKYDIVDTGNLSLTNCITPGLTCTQQSDTGFYFFDSNIPAVTQKISGPDIANAIHYDTFGNLCLTPGGSCIFDVTTAFTSQCPSASATCAAEYANVFVKYKIALNSTANDKSLYLKTIISQDYLVSKAQVNVATLATGSCPAEHFMLGRSKSGIPICTQSNGNQPRSPCTMPSGNFTGQLGQVAYVDYVKTCCILTSEFGTYGVGFECKAI